VAASGRYYRYQGDFYEDQAEGYGSYRWKDGRCAFLSRASQHQYESGRTEHSSRPFFALLRPALCRPLPNRPWRSQSVVAAAEVLQVMGALTPQANGDGVWSAVRVCSVYSGRVHAGHMHGCGRKTYPDGQTESVRVDGG